uniref:Uncharacterized protein n=1 Tax=Geladintestivirus 1 TaxID=3233133 RepID=A0AAU8MLQ4_9CAUD
MNYYFSYFLLNKEYKTKNITITDNKMYYQNIIIAEHLNEDTVIINNTFYNIKQFKFVNSLLEYSGIRNKFMVIILNGVSIETSSLIKEFNKRIS